MTIDRPIRTLEANEHTLSRMMEIGHACFDDYSLDLLTRNWRCSDARTCFLGAFDNDRLIAFNGFLAHPARLRGKDLLLFQSCHSATDPAFRGQGLFTKLISHALKTLDGDYLVGFPNDQSGPIFTGRLKFHSQELVRVWLPCLAPRIFAPILVRRRIKEEDLCEPDECAAAAWKEAEYPGEILTAAMAGNFIWGRIVRRSIAGWSFRVFEAGGIDLQNSGAFPALLATIAKQHRAIAVQIICTPDSPAAKVSRTTIAAPNTEPWIWHPLKDRPGEMRFAANIGLKDIW
jgi:GNAT superfamily N-acetyltransferase